MMILLKFAARKMTIIGVSACASITHGFAQVGVYCLFVQNVTAFYYYPLMSLIGIATGILIGILSQRIIATKVIERQKQRYGFNQPKKKRVEPTMAAPPIDESEKKEDESSRQA